MVEKTTIRHPCEGEDPWPGVDLGLRGNDEGR